MVHLEWLLLLSLYTFYTGATFWRLPCPNRSGTGRLDPLISPDGPSKHVHAIFGGNSKLLSPLQGALLTRAQTLDTILHMRT